MSGLFNKLFGGEGSIVLMFPVLALVSWILIQVAGVFNPKVARYTGILTDLLGISFVITFAVGILNKVLSLGR